MEAATDRLKTITKIYKICNHILKLCKEILFCFITETQHFPGSNSIYNSIMLLWKNTYKYDYKHIHYDMYSAFRNRKVYKYALIRI